MKCNICLEGDMNHEMVITDENTKEVTVLRQGTEEFKEVAHHVRHVNSQKTADGKRITHIYNCTECPNSQLEFWQNVDAEAYTAAMTGKATIIE